MPTIAQLRAIRASLKIDWTAQTAEDLEIARDASVLRAKINRAILAAVTAAQKTAKP